MRKVVETINAIRTQSKAMLGLDISSTSVKLLELSYQGGRYRVESYAVAPFALNAIVEKNIKDPQDVAQAITLAVERSKTRAKRAAVAVAGSSVIVKIIQLDSDLTEEEIESQIEVEADRYIPYPLEEVSLDFEVVGASEKNANLLDVLIVASRRENVDSRIEVIEDAGLNLVVVDVESYATQRACELILEQLPNKGVGESIAIVDIGATMTSVIVLYDRKAVYTREETFGGKLLTEEIQKRYGLSYAQAGYAKKHGDLPDDYIPEVLTPFKESMVQQIKRGLQFYYSANQYSEVSHVILAGGSATIPGLTSLVEEHVKIPTILANPFANMSLSSSVNPTELSNNASSLLVCCGLAMRGMS